MVILNMVIILLGTAGFLLFECILSKNPQLATEPLRNKIIDSFWWSCVTLATVGYGDISPKTFAGRAVGLFIMFSGIIVTSVITAIIASILVERKMREEKGLEGFDFRNHIVMCGWNENSDDILGAIAQMPNAPKMVVLINDLEEEKINEIKYRYRGEMDIRFIKGDFVNESVLERANIPDCYSAILLSDISGDRDRSKADERVILATLTIKHMSEKVRVTAELLDKDNRSHLQRARADEIVVRGMYSSYFLASSALSPGLLSVVGGLLSMDQTHQILKIQIPSKFMGHTFREVFDYFRNEHHAILFAIISLVKGMKFDDLLSEDLSAIDLFIKRKFQEAGADLSVSSDQTQISINPPDDYRIKENDYAVMIYSEHK